MTNFGKTLLSLLERQVVALELIASRMDKASNATTKKVKRAVSASRDDKVVRAAVIAKVWGYKSSSEVKQMLLACGLDFVKESPGSSDHGFYLTDVNEYAYTHKKKQLPATIKCK